MAERIRPSSSNSRFPNLIIANVLFTDTKLGRGADATVYEVEWNGTLCAAKRLHGVLLEDQSAGGVVKLISNFEAECVTWSKLRHPGIVQFLGVYLEHSSRLPVLVMEKMDTSLRAYLEDHSKDEFPLHQKVFVLRQVTQALAYLHSQNPPLVHHDLSTNNVLLNVVSFVTKISDFGMSRAINPSALSRKSSIKGTVAFLAPEALHSPPRYNEKLDVFSFGNVILHTLTHEWPDPGPPTAYKGDMFVAITELQRRKQYVGMFTTQEKQLFLPSIKQCLQNRPDERPSSVMLVQELRRIESSLPISSHVAASIEQLRQKNEALKKRNTVIRTLQADNQRLKTQNSRASEIQQQLVAKEEECKRKDEVVREKSATVQAQQAEIQRLRDRLALSQKVKHPPRDWRQLGECQRVIQHRPEGGWYTGVAVNIEGLLAVTDGVDNCVHLLTRDGTLVRSIGKGVLGGLLPGVAFDLKGDVWVAEWGNGTVVQLSQDDQLLQSMHHTGSENDRFIQPCGVSLSLVGLIYICDYCNHRVTCHDEEGKFLFAFGSNGSGPGCFDGPRDITFGSDGLVYVTDIQNKRVCVWSEEGTFRRDFKTKYAPFSIAATSDNHLLITSYCAHAVMVYTLEGELVHEFGREGYDPGKFRGPEGICVDGLGLIYVADVGNKRVQVF